MRVTCQNENRFNARKKEEEQQGLGNWQCTKKRRYILWRYSDLDNPNN